MDKLFEFVISWLVAVWDLLVDSAIFLAVGFVLAGMIHAFVSEKNLRRLIGGNRHLQVFKAAVVGVPLPLCSCSVLPVAHQLRQSGVSKGGTVSFLISTPESGVDSILLTYSLTDPILTVARPVTAFVTAAAAGLIENTVEAPSAPQSSEAPEQCDDCSCGMEMNEEVERSEPVGRRIWGGIRYAFTNLIDDLAIYLLVGYVLAGLVTVILGDGMLAVGEEFRTGWPGYAAALVIGLPLYICATSSTPLAAALLANGFSPGAILVFLIVGPATNIATLVVVGKMIQRWSLVRYLLTIVVIAVLAGLALDQIYLAFGMADWYEFMHDAHRFPILSSAGAIFIAILILLYSFRRMRMWFTGQQSDSK